MSLFFNVKILFPCISVKSAGHSLSRGSLDAADESLLFLSLMDTTLPLHLHTSRPETVLIVKSSPERENTFSFICSVCSWGSQNLMLGPSVGLKGARGAMLIVSTKVAMKCFCDLIVGVDTALCKDGYHESDVYSNIVMQDRFIRLCAWRIGASSSSCGAVLWRRWAISKS